MSLYDWKNHSIQPTPLSYQCIMQRIILVHNLYSIDLIDMKARTVKNIVTVWKLLTLQPISTSQTNPNIIHSFNCTESEVHGKLRWYTVWHDQIRHKTRTNEGSSIPHQSHHHSFNRWLKSEKNNAELVYNMHNKNQ